jgi:hypothetical protein
MKIKYSKVIEYIARKNCNDRKWKRNLGKMLKIKTDGWDWAFSVEFQNLKNANDIYTIPASYKKVMLYLLKSAK